MVRVGRGPLFWFVGLSLAALSLRVQFECGDAADCCSTLVPLCSKYSMLENHFISKKRFSETVKKLSHRECTFAFWR